MRPNASEVVRAIQAALMLDVAPELPAPFAQSELQNMQMLLEMIAYEAEHAADDLTDDVEALSRVLEPAASLLRGADSALAEELAAATGPPDRATGRHAELHERRLRLLALADRVLAACERPEATAAGELASVRREVYGHLRNVAARGWSFWDVSSFRERMARLRSGG